MAAQADSDTDPVRHPSSAGDQRTMLLCEGDVATQAEWNRRIHLTNAQFQSLVTSRVLCRTALPTNADQRYRLDLVGLLFTELGAFFAAPKVFNGQAAPHQITEVVSCIRAYRKRLSAAKEVEAAEIQAWRDDPGRRIDTFLSLIDWTLARGFQCEDLPVQSDDPSDINWGATFDDALPLHLKTGTIYTDVVAHASRPALGALSPIQAAALVDLHDKLWPISSLWLSWYDPLLDRARDILDDQDATSIVQGAALETVTDYLQSCNRDHDLELASILYDWLTRSTQTRVNPVAFGTTAFEYVWEDMCRSTITGLPCLMGHKEVASQPVYFLNHGEVQAASQRPDIVLNLGDGLAVLDAKWYKVIGSDFPGTPDIIKQIMYQATVSEDHTVKINAFLVPLAEDLPSARLLAHAALTGNQGLDPRFPGVLVIGLPWKLMASAYSQARHIPVERLLDGLTTEGEAGPANG